LSLGIFGTLYRQSILDSQKQRLYRTLILHLIGIHHKVILVTICKPGGTFV
jgi:hypothetical protein